MTNNWRQINLTRPASKALKPIPQSGVSTPSKETSDRQVRKFYELTPFCGGLTGPKDESKQ